jgi:hypothetical protein
LALRDYINKEGKYFAVYCNIEPAQAAFHDAQEGISGIIGEIQNRLEDLGFDKTIIDNIDNVGLNKAATIGLNSTLAYISKSINKPVIFFIDEIDALIGDTLIAVLRQIRNGYDKRPDSFPISIILCGVRDIKDYRITSSKGEIVTGGSAFNVKAKSLRLGNFSKDDVVNLYTQHTNETGQVFENECFDLIMEYTDGQPWLVNALAHEVTDEMRENRDRTITITPAMIEEAKERLILSRQTHLDQLVDKLQEERVQRVILPMILGADDTPNVHDIEYCVDLGLIKRVDKKTQISNQIYAEVIPRELTHAVQDTGFASIEPLWLAKDGSLDVNALLTLFKDFWNENSNIWGTAVPGYKEAAPQLVLQAYLQRIVNGGGYINREYALGSKRTDLHIKWHYKIDGKLHIQNIVIELKVINNKQTYESVKQTAIIQTVKYAKICGQDTAHILIFDRNNSQNWSADIPNEYTEHDGVKLEIWRLGQGIFGEYSNSI